MCKNHLSVLDEKQKNALDSLEEEHHVRLTKQRRIWEEELKMKLCEQNRRIILEEEFKLEEDRRRLSAFMELKLEEQRRDLVAKKEVQVVDLKRKYGLSDKQKYEVNKILKELNKTIAKREKKYEKVVKHTKKKEKPDTKERLNFELEKKQHKINQAKRQCNEKLYKLEQVWIKEWIVRVESMQKSRSNNSSIPTSCSINNSNSSNTSVQQHCQQQQQ